MRRSRPSAAVATAGAVIAAIAMPFTFAGPASAAPTQQTITADPQDSAGWVPVAYYCTGDYVESNQAFVAGPEGPPVGEGSRRFTIGADSNLTEIFRTAKFDGTRLADIDDLGYSTYAESNGLGTQQQPPYLRLTVDPDGDPDTDNTESIFFIPGNNVDTEGRGALEDTWQTYDVDAGQFSVGGDNGPGDTTTLDAYVTSHPQAELVNNAGGTPEGGALSVMVGCTGAGQQNSDFYADRVVFGTTALETTYDFEPAVDMRRVSTSSPQGWVPVAYDCTADYLASNQAFVAGPEDPPAGEGSRRFTIGADSNLTEIFRTAEFDGTRLADIDALGYSTYAESNGLGTQQQPPYLRLTVDPDGPTGNAAQESLFFIPGNNVDTEGRGALEDTWQTYDVDAGQFSVGGDNGPGDTTTLDEYVTSHPQATLVNNAGGTPEGGALSVMVGCTGAAQQNSDFYTDRVVFGEADESVQIFDFEPEQAPSFTNEPSATGTVGIAMDGAVDVTVSATPTATLTVDDPADLPPGVTLRDNGDNTGTLVGTPSAAGTYVVTLRADNGVSPDATQEFTITISPAAQESSSPPPGGGGGGGGGGTTTSPSPSPSSSGSASPSGTPSSSATASRSPSGVPAVPCTNPASVTLERSTIIATGSAGVTVRATPNSIVQLSAYTRPSTTYRVVREAEVGENGIAEFRITPPANTRLFAQQQGCDASPSVVLNVRTALSLNVVRNGVRTYTFSGDSLPARPGGLIVSLYRLTSDGRQILTAQTRASASTGDWFIRRVFTGSGRFGFVVRTGQDLQNAPGSSNVRSLLVF